MGRFSALLVGLTLLAGCVTLPEPDFSPAGPHLSILTYNVNVACSSPGNVVAHLLEADADIVCLQETHAEWEAVLRQHLAENYPHSHFLDVPGAGGLALMSKLELRDVARVEPSAGWFAALKAKAMSPFGPVQVLNVHLRPAVSDRGYLSASAAYSNRRVHRRELEHLMGVVRAEAPLVVAGDFNEGERGKGVRYLVEMGFADALSIYDRRSPTWRWRVAWGIALKRRYDHIISSRHLRCTGARVSAVNASDHMPVFAVFVPAEAPCGSAEPPLPEGRGSEATPAPATGRQPGS